MFVTNKPGVTGSLGAADVIASKPDGYKLFESAQSFFASTIHTQEIAIPILKEVGLYVGK
jgi:tripartite-type tricarboxylate transporter receptor subunit TctC